jgi:hypothetical protein
MKAVNVLCVFAGICLGQPKAWAGTFGSSFGCEGAAGAVIFQDTLYGAGIAGILSGLYVWSKNDDKGFNKERAMANGLLTGATLGVGLGITEIVMRECAGSSSSAERRKAAITKPASPLWKIAFEPVPRPDQAGWMPAASWRVSF